MTASGEGVQRGDPAAERPEMDQVLALHEERATVLRRQTPGDVVSVRVRTTQGAHEVEETLHDERVEIERRPIGREVAVAPGIVEDGELTIIPVMGEVVVSETRLVLIEEIHIRRVRVSRPHHETIMLRTEQAVISRDHQPAHDTSETTDRLSTIDQLSTTQGDKS